MDGSLAIGEAGDERELYLEGRLAELDEVEPLLADLAGDVAAARR